MELPMKQTIDVREIPAAISNSGKVRLGSLSAGFPPVYGQPANTSDTGKVRLGNMSPAFPTMPPLVRGRPVTVSATGEVRIGAFSPVESSTSAAGEPNIRIAAASPTFVWSR
jgi:hypothetical protein